MCFANAVAERDASENETLSKERRRGPIDGAVAASMALGRAAADAGDSGSIVDLDVPDSTFFV
jgi:phage terminase large subunit-like protein